MLKTLSQNFTKYCSCLNFVHWREWRASLFYMIMNIITDLLVCLKDITSL